MQVWWCTYKSNVFKKVQFLYKMGNVGMFDNVLFDNYLDFVRQLKNRLFLGHFFVHVTGRNKN